MSGGLKEKPLMAVLPENKQFCLIMDYMVLNQYVDAHTSNVCQALLHRINHPPFYNYLDKNSDRLTFNVLLFVQHLNTI